MLSKNILIIIVLLVLIGCTERKNNYSNDLVIKSHTINETNQLVYCIQNKSRNDLLILNYFHEIHVTVYKRKSDSGWINISHSFYNSSRKFLDTAEIFKTHTDEICYKYDKRKPETSRFYDLVIGKIYNDSLSKQADLLWEFDNLICNSLFLKQGEMFCDTISLSIYKKKHPNMNLKFDIAYPGINLHNIDMTYLEFYVNSILADSLGITLPESLDGFEVIYNVIVQDEIIISASN